MMTILAEELSQISAWSNVMCVTKPENEESLKMVASGEKASNENINENSDRIMACVK